MNEEQMKALNDAEFFTLFLAATKTTYKKYCEFTAGKEGLMSYSEPEFDAVMNVLSDRFESKQNRISELEHALTQVVTLAECDSEIFGGARSDIAARAKENL